MNNNKIIFVLNPISGFLGFRRRKIERIIKRYIYKNEIDGEIWHSKYAGHTTELVRQAAEQQVKTVVVAGGDGSINEAARALVHSDTALGIIPAGSGNGLAHYLKIPFNIVKAIDVIVEGNTKQADVLKVNDNYAFSLAGLGLDAMIASRYKTLKQRGFLAYLHCAVMEYFNYTPEKVIIKTDTMELDETCVFMVFANSDQFGYNFRIAPQADLFDGYIDVVVVKKFPFIAAPLSSIKIWSGQANKILYFSSFKTKKAVITRENSGMVNLDGDPYETDKTVTVEVMEKALNLIVPSIES